MYEKIFWLDDNFDGLYEVALLTCKTSEEINPEKLKNLAKKISMAFDFESGKDLVKSQEFDLYILDADFPDKLSEQKITQRKTYFENLSNGLLNFPSDYNSRYVGDNFENFYPFIPKGKKTVIFSSSKVALGVACNLNLPFYSKCLGSFDWDLVKKALWIMRGVKLQDKPDWEHGNLDDFIKNYFI